MPLLLALALLASACSLSASQECTLAGCVDQYIVDLRAIGLAHPDALPVVASACIDEACDEGTIDPELFQLKVVGDWGEDVTVDVVLTSPQGGDLIEWSIDDVLHKTEPNGPDCGPTCWQGTAVYEPDRGAVVAANLLPERTADDYPDCPCSAPWQR